MCANIVFFYLSDIFDVFYHRIGVFFILYCCYFLPPSHHYYEFTKLVKIKCPNCAVNLFPVTEYLCLCKEAFSPIFLHNFILVSVKLFYNNISRFCLSQIFPMSGRKNLIFLEFHEIKAKIISVHAMKALCCADIGQIIPNDSNGCECVISSTA